MKRSHGHNVGKSRTLLSKGRISITRQLVKLEVGDTVRITPDVHSRRGKIKLRYAGRMGKIVAKQGRAYVVELKDIGKTKRFVLTNMHLKKV